MVKLVFCVRRKPELTREEFQRYWLDEHGPLVRSLREAQPGLRRYVQSHTIDIPASELARSSRGLVNPMTASPRFGSKKNRWARNQHPNSSRPESGFSKMRAPLLTLPTLPCSLLSSTRSTDQGSAENSGAWRPDRPIPPVPIIDGDKRPTPGVWGQPSALPRFRYLQDALQLDDRLDVPVLVCALTGPAGVTMYRQHPGGFRPQHVIKDTVTHIGNVVGGKPRAAPPNRRPSDPASQSPLRRSRR